MNGLKDLYFYMPKADTSSVMENYANALAIRGQFYGNDHKDLGTTLNNVGRVHYIQSGFHGGAWS